MSCTPLIAFHEVRFPTDYQQGTSGGPMFQTRVTATDSGSEQRVQMWANARLAYDVGYVADPAGMEAIIAFFRARKGRAFGFRFKDWADYKTTLQPCTTIDGTHVQLTKLYTDTAGSESRRITKPVNNGTFKIYKDAVLDTGTVDYTTGIVTVASGTHVWTWSGEFDVPVRFDVDKLAFIQETVARRSLSSLPLVELLY